MGLTCPQENAGNDVTTQIVPTSSGGGWQQPQGEQQTPAVNRPNWAASGGDPAPAFPSGPARDRRLNPHDYPSLSAAAAARHQSKQPVPSVPESQVRTAPCSSRLLALWALIADAHKLLNTHRASRTGMRMSGAYPPRSPAAQR